MKRITLFSVVTALFIGCIPLLLGIVSFSETGSDQKWFSAILPFFSVGLVMGLFVFASMNQQDRRNK